MDYDYDLVDEWLLIEDGTVKPVNRTWSSEFTSPHHSSNSKLSKSLSTPGRKMSEEENRLNEMRLALQGERQQFQAKIYTTWLNSKLSSAPGSPKIDDIFQDLRDGKLLLLLLGVLTSEKKLKPVKGNLSLHHLNNLTLVLDTLQKYKVKLVGFSNQSILNGEKVPTLGLCWSIIYRFQVLGALESDGKAGNAEKALLSWINESLEGYNSKNVSSFQPKQWKDGYLFCSLLHVFKPELFDIDTLKRMNDLRRWEFGIDTAHNNYDVNPLFSAEDMNEDAVDSRTLVLYISSVYEKLKDKVPSNKLPPVLENQEEEIVAMEASVDESSQVVVDNLLSSMEQRSKDISKEKESPFLTSPQTDQGLKAIEKHLSDILDLEKRVKKMNVADIKGEVDLALSINNISENDVKTLDESMSKLENDYKDLTDQIYTDKNRTQDNFAKEIEKQLDNINELLNNTRSQQNKFAQTEPISSASLESLEADGKTCEDLLSDLRSIQPLLKHLCKMTDDIINDDSHPSSKKSHLKEKAEKTKKDFSDLMDSLDQDKERLSIGKLNYQNNIKALENNWLENLENIQNWLNETLKDVKEREKLGKPNNEDEALKRLNEVKTARGELEENWKTYQELGNEWNTELCDKLQNELYADMLLETKDDFNTLNKELSEQKSKYGKLLKEYTDIKILNAWKQMYNPKMEKLKFFSQSIPSHPQDSDFDSVEKWNDEVKEVEKEFEQYVNRLNEVMDEKAKILADNKKVSSKIKKVMDDDIEHMKSFLDNEKKLVDELKLKALESKELMARENDHIYKDWFDKFIEVNHAIADLASNVQEVNQEDNEISAEKMEQVLRAVNDYAGTYNGIQSTGAALLNENRLSKEKKDSVGDDKNTLENNWNNLSDSAKTLKKRLKAKKAEEDGLRNSAITDWKVKVNDTNHVLENNENNNVFTSPLPNNLKDLNKYSENLKKAEKKFGDDKNEIAENLQWGQDLIDSKKIKEKEAIDEICLQMSDIQDRRNALDDKFDDLNKRVDESKQNLLEVENIQYENWCGKLSPVEELIKKDCNISKKLLNGDDSVKPDDIQDQLEKMRNEEELIEETINDGLQCSNDDALGEMKSLEVEKQVDDLKKDYNEFKVCKASLEKKLDEKKSLLLDDWDKKLQNHQNFIKAKTTTLHGIEAEDDIHVALQEIEVVSDEIDKKEPSIEEFIEESENCLKDKLLDDLSKKRVEETYKNLANDWNALKERNIILDNRLHKKRMEEEGMSNKLMTEWDERVEKLEDLLSNIENDDVFQKATPKSFDEIAKLEKDIKALEFRFDVESKVIDGHLEFGKYLSDGTAIKNERAITNIQSQVEEYESRQDDCRDRISKLHDKLASAEEELLIDQNNMMEDWKEKCNEVIEESDNLNGEITEELSSGTNDSDNLKQLQDQSKKLMVLLKERINEGSEIQDGGSLNEDGKQEVERDLKKLHKQLSMLEKLDKQLDEKKENIQSSVFKAWLDELVPLQEFVKDKNAMLNHMNMRDNLDDLLINIKELSDEVEAKNDDVEGLQEEKDKLVNNPTLLDEKSRNSLQDNFEIFLKDWSALQERLEISKNRLLELQMEEEGASNEILKEWQSKAEHIEDWLYQCENEPLLAADIPDNFFDLDALEQKEKNLAFQVRTEEKVIDEKLQFGENLLKGKKLKDPNKKSELHGQLAEFNKRKRALSKNLEDIEERCKHKRDNLEKIGEEIYNEWKDSNDKLHESLQRRCDQGDDYDEQIKFDEVEVTEEQVAAHLEQCQLLENEASKHIDDGSTLAGSNKIPNVLKEKINEHCVTTTKYLEEMKQRNELLKNWLDRIASSALGNWQDFLSALQAFVRETSNKMNTIDMSKDIEKALDVIKEISGEINEKEEAVLKLKGDADAIVHGDNTNKIDEKSKLSVETSCSSFIEDWNALKDRKDALKLSLESRQAEDMELSSHSMKEWREKAHNINSWLEDAENNPLFQNELPDNVQDLEQHSSQLENLIFKLTTEEKIIEDQLEFGVNLSKSGKIKNPSYLDSLKNELGDFNERKKHLNDMLLQLNNRVADALKEVHDKENDEYKKWIDEADEVKTKLANFEETGKEVVIKSSRDADAVIEKQKVYKKQLYDFEEKLEALIDSGNSLIDEKRLSNRKSQDVKSEIRLIEQRWAALNKQAVVLEERYEDIAAMFNSESDEKADNLLTRIQLFREWLDLGQQQLDFYQNSDEAIPFKDLMQREQGLMKLSTDLESRAREFNDLQRGTDNLKKVNPGEQLKGKSKEAADKMEDLENLWSDIIDNIDKELKDLYDQVNSSLDKSRGAIDNSLKKIEKDLDKILNEDIDKDSIIDQTKHLGAISSELSSHGPAMKKLSSQTNSVSDVTLFKDSEKDLMKQSFDELAERYKHCQSSSEKAKKRLRDHILEYFNSRCEAVCDIVRALNDESIDVDDDEEDVDVLKKYLKAHQDVVSNVKVEEYNMSDVEKFAEKVSLLGLLDSDDQMRVAHAINKSLKAIEDLKQNYRAKMNRVYAVLVHSLKVRQQNASQKLQEIDKEAELCDCNESLQTFQDAVRIHDVLKDLDLQLQNTIDCIDEIKTETSGIKDTKVLEASDVEKISTRTSDLLQESMTSSETLGICKKRFANNFRGLAVRKLDEFWGWLPIMQKRSSEGNEIGPDLFAVKKQLQEMQVISSQTQDKSFKLILKNENRDIFESLPVEERNEVESADKEWDTINDWQEERTSKLERANSLWEEFNHNESDLLDYLRDNEKEEKAWGQLDLNDPESVAYCRSVFAGVMEGLEIRKPHVKRLEDTGDEIVGFLSDDSPVVDNVRSRVADIHDAWNKTVKKSIENLSKLRKCCDLLEKLEEGAKDLRNWITETNNAVKDFEDNKRNERVLKLREAIEVQNEEKKNMRDLLLRVNQWNDELNNDEMTRSHFSVDDDLTALSYDFDDAVKLLDYFDTFRGKGFVLWRRMKQGVGDGATKTKQMFDSKDEMPSEQTAEGVMVDEKTTDMDENKNT